MKSIFLVLVLFTNLAIGKEVKKSSSPIDHINTCYKVNKGKPNNSYLNCMQSLFTKTMTAKQVGRVVLEFFYAKGETKTIECSKYVKAFYQNKIKSIICLDGRFKGTPYEVVFEDGIKKLSYY